MQFKKAKRVLAIIMAAAITLGSFSVPAYAIDTTKTSYTWSTTAKAAAEYKTTLSGKVSFSDPVYGAAYVATSKTDFRKDVSNDWKNSTSASSNITAVTLSDGSKTETIKAKNGGVLTLVVTKDDGSVEYQDILDLVENKTSLDADKFVIVESEEIEDYSEFAKFGDMLTNFGQYTMRAALYVKDGAISATHSVQQLLAGATVNTSGSTTTISNGTLTLNGPFINGIVANDTDSTSVDTTVNVDKMKLYAKGDGANDFRGEGAVLFADGNSTMNISNTYIGTEGVIRTAAAASGKSVLNINDSVIYTEESNDTKSEYDSLVVPMMKRTPFALGIEGVVRATNILGAAQGVYKNSLIVSSGWGVLSTDSGTAYSETGTYALNVSDTVAGVGTVEVAQSGKTYTATKTVDGVTYGFTQGGSGYVAYADSGVFDKFNNVKFYSDDYAQIMASTQSSAYYTNSEINAGRIAVMTQQNAGGTISIKDSTVNVGDTAVQIKSGAANAGYTYVTLDNAKINLSKTNKWGGTLVELVESDDAGNPGNTTYTIKDEGDKAVAGQSTLPASTATLKNGTYTGNIWNNIYNNTELLDVTVDSATVNGTISSSYGYHVADNGTRLANGTILTACTTADYRATGASSGDYKKIGAQYNVANQQLNNPINVTLKNNSTWNVVLADGTNGEAAACYINNLTVEKGSQITADTSKYSAANPLTIYVYGKQDIQGTVASNIKLVASTVDMTGATDDGVTAATSFYDGTKVNYYVVNQYGQPSKASATVEYHAFNTINFNVTAADGVTIESVTADKATVSDATETGYKYLLTNKSGNKDAVTVTIKVNDPNATKPAETAKVTVNAPKTVKAAAKSGKKAVVKWSTVKTATKYQVQYSTSKKFTKKTSTLKTYKSTTKSATISSLKAGKKYYVRVRAVNVSSDGTKTFGTWSAVKTVTAKK